MRAEIFTIHHDPNSNVIPLSLADWRKGMPLALSYIVMKSHQHMVIKNASLTIVQIMFTLFILQSYEN